jgi:hypothetical protein
MVDQTVAHDLVCTDAGSPIAPRSPNAERNAEIIRRRKDGQWPRQIADEMGLPSKSIVIGVCNRAGLAVPGAYRIAAEEYRAGLPPNPPKPVRTRRQISNARVQSMRRHWDGLGSAAYIPFATRVAVVADHLAGLSLFKTARKHDVARGSVMNWLKRQEVVAAARPIADKIRAEKAAAKQRAAEFFAAQKAEQEARQAAINAPILAQLSGRVLAMCEAYLKPGGTLQSVGDTFGVTRERVRQIIAPAVRAGLVKDGKTLRPSKAGLPTGRPRGRPSWKWAEHRGAWVA